MFPAPVHKVILISGDRNWGNRPYLDDDESKAEAQRQNAEDRLTFGLAMDKWVAKHGLPQVIVEGCARGADRAAEWWASNHPSIHVAHYPADWAREGKAAGPLRNIRMLKEGKPSAVIAFHRDLARSKGTGHMVKIALAAGIKVWVPCPQPQLSLFTKPSDLG